MKFSPILTALFILAAAICLTPQAEDATFASSCAGQASRASCGGEPSRATPVRNAIAKQPVRKTLSVLKPNLKSCNGE